MEVYEYDQKQLNLHLLSINGMMTTKADARKLNRIKSVVAETVIPGNGLQKNLVESYGKTPARTVSMTLTTSKGVFTRVGEGIYILNVPQKGAGKSHTTNSKRNKKDFDKINEFESYSTPCKLVPSYGMYWMREAINWESVPKLLGVESTGASPIDLSEMRGIYMLYDGREVIYVGQAIDRPLIKRLSEHTKNRLATRWNRFSWFGLDSVHPGSGKIEKQIENFNSDLHSLANVLEGILIEGLEPRQNRKQGDNFGFEYYQEIDKEILKDKLLSNLKKL